jgi:hypothetical protein
MRGYIVFGKVYNTPAIWRDGADYARSTGLATDSMILWRLQGYSDPEGEYTPSEVVCSIERLTTGYRLLVEHGSELQIDEMYP